MLLHNYPSGVADQKDTLYKKPSDLFMITVMKRFVEIASKTMCVSEPLKLRNTSKVKEEECDRKAMKQIDMDALAFWIHWQFCIKILTEEATASFTNLFLESVLQVKFYIS